MKAFSAGRLVTFSFTWLADEEHRLSSRPVDDGAIRSMNKMLSIRPTGKAGVEGKKKDGLSEERKPARVEELSSQKSDRAGSSEMNHRSPPVST